MAQVERAPSLAAAARLLRPGPVGAEGAVRWVKRRVRRVGRALRAARGMLPGLLAACPAEVLPVRARLGVPMALTGLRAELEPQLAAVPAPLGFYPQGPGAAERSGPRQHQMGPDPPDAGR